MDKQALEQALKDQRELIQNDITCILDGLDEQVINNVCQVVVDRFAILLLQVKEG